MWKSASSWTEAEVIFGSAGKTLQAQARAQARAPAQTQLPVRRTQKPIKRNVIAAGFVFPVSLLLTADTHQETMQMFWLYGWEALILTLFTASEEKTRIKTLPHCRLFWKKLRHQTPEPCCIFSQARDVLTWDLLDLFLNGGAKTHRPFITPLLH